MIDRMNCDGEIELRLIKIRNSFKANKTSKKCHFEENYFTLPAIKMFCESLRKFLNNRKSTNF